MRFAWRLSAIMIVHHWCCLRAIDATTCVTVSNGVAVTASGSNWGRAVLGFSGSQIEPASTMKLLAVHMRASSEARKTTIRAT